jgi:hypothetical protein
VKKRSGTRRQSGRTASRSGNTNEEEEDEAGTSCGWRDQWSEKTSSEKKQNNPNRLRLPLKSLHQ